MYIKGNKMFWLKSPILKKKKIEIEKLNYHCGLNILLFYRCFMFEKTIEPIHYTLYTFKL